MNIKSLAYLNARIREINEASPLLIRNADLKEWNAMESNLYYIAAKAEAALSKLHAMQQAWIAEMDAK